MYIVAGDLRRFAVAVELEGVEGKYDRVVGIDNFHDYAHRHVFRRDGSQVSAPVPMPDSHDTSLAMDWSIDHLIRSYRAYVDRYLDT